MRKTFTLRLVLGALVLGSCTFSTKEDQAIASIHHVIVIGVDGLSPDGIQRAKTPLLDSMISKGASTFNARAVLPTSSSSNWASMLLGAGTEQHGVTSNGWEKHDHQLPSAVSTPNGSFPSIFTLFKDQKPDAHIGAIYDWDGFGRLFEQSEVDFNINGDHEEGTTADAVSYIKENKPQFTFIHLDHVDHAGHSEGHGTKAYYQSVEKADSLIAEIVEATKEAQIFDKTMFLVCSDHGGLGKGHGGESLAEVNVPFILFGAGIKQGYTMQESVYQYDNAPTVAYAFGLKTPQAWIGRPVLGAFIGNETPELIYKRKELLAPPIISPSAGDYEPAGGLFRGDSTLVVMKNPNNKGELYYSLDGGVPTTQNHLLYQTPFYIDQTTVIRAAIFEDGEQRSEVADGNFRIVAAEKENPLSYAVYYMDDIKRLPEHYSAFTPVMEGRCEEFSFTNLSQSGKIRTKQVMMVYQGYLDIETEGEYIFYTNSDDGSTLSVNGIMVVDNDGDHGVIEKSGKITLNRGRHPITVKYFNGGGGFHLDVRYKGPKIPKQIIPSTKLYPLN